MKLSKLITFTMATLALGACSNDDDLTNGGATPEPGKGELIEAISIAFGSSSAKTRAYDGEVAGTGTEDKVYVAYVFARENDPQHTGKKEGDWTVKRVVNGEAATDADAKTPIADGTADGTKGKLCTFNGVQQGDSVYVIVNDPNMDMDAANTLAHNGKESQAKIRGYVSELNKEYLNGLTVAEDGQQAGRFIMAGAAVIPTNPTTPNGGTVSVTVDLNREVAKVAFNASVTTDKQYEAADNITIKDATDDATKADGLIIVRIPTRVSPFTTQARNWYFPLSADDTAKDWDVAKWLEAFDGDEKANPDGAMAEKVFNKAPYNADAKEYRLTWKVGNVDGKDENKTKVYIKNKTLISPYFYVTPNYSNHSGCSTVIVTQATYTGANTLLESAVTEEMLEAALKNPTFTTATGLKTLKDIKPETWNTESNVKALIAFIETVEDYKSSVLRGATTEDNKIKAISIKPGDKRYYRADVANMDGDNSMKLTERNTFYEINGTITTLGAKTIEDVINTDNINMVVKVVVKNWKSVKNNVNM